MENISFTQELESIREWKEVEAIEAEKSQVGMAKRVWDKIFWKGLGYQLCFISKYFEFPNSDVDGIYLINTNK